MKKKRNWFKDKNGILTFRSGEKANRWLHMAIPVLMFLPILLKKTWKHIHKQTLYLTCLCFYPTMAFIEMWALRYMWWNYNEYKDFFNIKGIPITEIGVYYIYPTIFTIGLYELFNKWFKAWMAFIMVMLVNAPLVTLYEYLGVDVFEIWDFHESYMGLWGPTFLGYPIEEFVFWIGAPFYIMSLYLFFKTNLRTSQK